MRELETEDRADARAPAEQRRGRRAPSELAALGACLRLPFTWTVAAGARLRGSTESGLAARPGWCMPARLRGAAGPCARRVGAHAAGGRAGRAEVSGSLATLCVTLVPAACAAAGGLTARHKLNSVARCTRPLPPPPRFFPDAVIPAATAFLS